MTPLLIGLFRQWPNHASQWWAWPLFLLLVLFLSALAWFIPLRLLIRRRLWALPRTWYEACLGIAFLYIFYALFVLATGYTPSKYHSHPVPRSASLIFLYWAAIPLIVGAAFYVYEKYGAPNSRR